MDLGLFFIQQADQVVFCSMVRAAHEDGLPAGTGAVDHALHAAFLLDFHRYDKRSPRW